MPNDVALYEQAILPMLPTARHGQVPVPSLGYTAIRPFWNPSKTIGFLLSVDRRPKLYFVVVSNPNTKRQESEFGNSLLDFLHCRMLRGQHAVHSIRWTDVCIG